MVSKTNKYLTSILVILISLYYRPISATQHGLVHFVLVHGAGHGAWCWYKLIPILKSQGHNVTAVNLAASGIDLRRAETLRSVAEYIGPLMGLMESLGEDEKVILVAHSLGGLAISKAMEMFYKKVHMAIFVTALMPGPTFNFSLLSQGLVRWQAPQLDLKFVFGDGPNKSPTLSIGGPLFISLTMYDLSPKEDVELAALLVRPQRLFSNADIDTSLVLTPERFGSVNRIFVVSEKDKSLVKEFQLWMIKNNPPNHVEHIQNSDHMVMISRPLDLGACLLSLAKKFA
ncbi:Alpha/Beta hydrolase fold [Arabidopsis suecica]|uniref:Methylesterase n=1 Tax=Arabidopsis suecica TaxID=45249 RepID=A0A8T2BF03_ARASU|nr:Alpha/Beta hydrolase fold [Arabidopsis suecica]